MKSKKNYRKKKMQNKALLDILLTNNRTDFVNNIEKYIQSLGIKKYIIWDINNMVATVNISKVDNSDILFADIIDLGHLDQDCNVTREPVRLSDDILIYKTLFFEHLESIMMAISICEPIAFDCSNLLSMLPYLSAKLYDLIAAEQRTDIFIEYQKKIDFIKKAYDILKFLEFETILVKSLNFYMEIFDAQAGFIIYNNEFHSFGIEKDSLEAIFINSICLSHFLPDIDKTEFIESGIESKRFLINNIFIIYEQKHNIKILLFNISTNFYPDKEFSEIISHITSIAMENAINHQRELNLKLEENEMKTTADILNRFVDKEVSYSSKLCDIFGVSYPAKQTGGDFLSIYETDKKIIICLADVCGKGYSAAVITVAMSTMFQFFTKMKHAKPSYFAANLSRFLLEKNLDGRFVTLFLGIIDTENYKMDYISLGHEPVFVVYEKGVQKLTSNYMPAGIIEEKYIDSNIEIFKNSSIFVYSDGLVEYITYNEIEKKLIENPLDTKTFIKSMYDELVIDKNHQMDDFTCIKIDIKG